MRQFKALVILALVFPMTIISQEKSGNKDDEAVEVDLFFNEFTASINMTTVQNDNTSNGVGGGLGIYRSWRNDKIVNIIHGLEYNYSSQKKDKVYEGSNYAYYNDVKYKMHNISVPVLVRFSFGEKTKLFVETGGFMEFALGSKREGVYKTTDQDGAPMDVSVNEEANLKYFNYGFSAGLGARIPVSKVDLLIKLDYKFGIPDLYTYDEKIYNRYLRFTFGVNLR